MTIQVVKIREFAGHSQAVYTMCKAGDDSLFYSGGGDGMLVRWTLDEPDGTLVARHDAAIYALFNGAQYLFSGTQKGVLSVFEPEASGLLRQLKLVSSPIFDIMEFAGCIVVATGEGRLIVMDREFNVVKSINLSMTSLRKLLVHDGCLYVTGTDGMIRIMNASFILLNAFPAQELSVFAMAFHRKSGTILSGGRNAVVRIHRNEVLVETINAHLLHIHDIALNDAQTFYLTCSMDKTIKLWDAAGNSLLKVISMEKHGGHASSVNKILWFDKNNFISCSDDRTLKCFEIQEK